jgi:hypothetical protein
MSQQSALKEIDLVIAKLDGVLTAAKKAREAITIGDAAALEEAIIDLEDQEPVEFSTTDMLLYHGELTDVDAEGAAADERVDRERVERAVEAGQL